MLALSSCNEVPEDVKSRAAEQNGDTDSKVQAVVVDESTGEQHTADKIGNITFDCTPEPTEANDFYVLKSRAVKKPDANDHHTELAAKMQKCSKELMGVDTALDRITITTGKTDESGQVTDLCYFPSAMYNDDNGHTFEIFEGNDSFVFYNSERATGTVLQTYLEREVYFPDACPYTEYQMNDGSRMTIAKAREQADAIIKKCRELELLDKNVTLVLDKVAIHKTDGEGDVIDLFYRKKEFGVYLNSDGLLSYIYGEEEEALRYSFFEISFLGDNDPLRIKNLYSDILEKGESVGVMSFDEAKQRLVTGLAKNKVYTIKEAELRYTCICTNNAPQNTYRPMWCFILEDSNLEHRTYTPEEAVISIDNTQFYRRVTAFVDAVNGDIWYCDPFNRIISKQEK